MATYIAKVPLVIAKDESGRDVYIYQDFQVPSNVTDDSIKLLLEGEFIAKVEEPASAEPKAITIPDGDPSDSWTKDQLTAYAARESIDVSAAKTKPELLELVTKK
jgi:hypothetical protein